MGERESREVADLAAAAARAMAELGSCPYGTWQERKEALYKAGEMESSGFDEVVGWFADD